MKEFLMKFNILIAEDETEVRNILKSLVEMIFLKYFPYLQLNVSTAENGLIALNIAKEERQDIIITDIVMPIMDGIEEIIEIRKFDKSVPILVLSALSNNEDVNKIMQTGANNYTNKPLNAKLFTAQIRTFVDFYLRKQSKYNHSAINLFTKNIYKRKTDFLIEKEDDIIEFWEFLIEERFSTYNININNVLQFVYYLELMMVKNKIQNNIILEESSEKFYFTILGIDKIDKQILSKEINKYKIEKSIYKTDGFFMSLIIDKQKEVTLQEIERKISQEINHEIKDKESKIKDIRYSIHEEISPDDFINELDPTIEDKIGNFLDDLSLLSISIYDLEENPEKAKEEIKNIISYLNSFNNIVETLGLFSIINRSFNNLCDFLETVDDEFLHNGEKRILLATMLGGLCDDLERWIYTMFIDKNARDIHYLDASFADNCYVIESTFSQAEDNSEDGELEFF
jgi:two-component system chemotaxis response regulator CheY